MDWTQTLAIILSIVVSLGGSVFFINRNHREDMQIMRDDMKLKNEQWKWLFDWAHDEVNNLKSNKNISGKN